jgi:tetratricopeptide (TPR) repeat protein
VLAQPDSAGYRLRKFVRRNPLAAGAMAALFLVLAGGIVATTWQAHIANQARRAAERRFRDAHTLAMSLISAVNDSIARLPGATRTRHFLVARALGALDTLAQHAQDARDDRDIQYDLAVAYIKAGDLQGKPTISNLGETNAALDSYNKARVMLASLATTHPIDTRVERQLALADERISAIYHRAHDRVHSEHYARLAIAIDEALVHADPANESDQEALATSLISLGDALAASNEEWSVARSRAARDSYARALAIYQMLAARGPMTPAVQRGLLIGYTRLGYAGAWTWAATHDVAELRTALARHLQSQRLRRALLAADPGSASNQRLVADGWMDVAQAQRVLGDIPHALASYDSAGPLFQSLAAVDGTNIEARRDLAYYHENFGHALADAHQLARAIQHERTAVAILSALQRADPADNEDYWHICHAQDVVAHALEGLGAEASARAAYGDLITTLQGWITAEPDNVQGHRMLRDARARLAALTP